MTLDDIEDRIYELEKAEEIGCPAKAGLEKGLFLEFIKHVASTGEGQIQEMASCIFSQYHAKLAGNDNEPEHNICEEVMKQIEADAISGRLEFYKEKGSEVYMGTNVRVVNNKRSITISKLH